MEAITTPWGKFLALWEILFIIFAFSVLLIAIGKRDKVKIKVYLGAALILFGVIIFCWTII